MAWRVHIEDEAQRHPDFIAMVRGGGEKSRALLYAVRRMKDDAADDVQRELDADCDPVALQRRTARLSLLIAFLTNESPDFPMMTDEERAAVGLEPRR